MGNKKIFANQKMYMTKQDVETFIKASEEKEY